MISDVFDLASRFAELSARSRALGETIRFGLSLALALSFVKACLSQLSGVKH